MSFYYVYTADVLTHDAEGGMIRMLIEVIYKKSWKQSEYTKIYL